MSVLRLQCAARILVAIPRALAPHRSVVRMTSTTAQQRSGTPSTIKRTGYLSIEKGGRI